MMTIVHRTRPRPSYVLINTLDAKSEKIPASQTIATVEAECRGLTWGGGSAHNDIDIIHKLQSIKNNFISHD